MLYKAINLKQVNIVVMQDLPSLRRFPIIPIFASLLVNPAAIEASPLPREIPISAHFNAEISLEPSPHTPTKVFLDKSKEF